jgi:hypothetical protein
VPEHFEAADFSRFGAVIVDPKKLTADLNSVASAAVQIVGRGEEVGKWLDV